VRVRDCHCDSVAVLDEAVPSRKVESMQGMMDRMMGGMTLWTVIGVLLVVLLVVVIVRLVRK
jgi:hypothetical protein